MDRFTYLQDGRPRVGRDQYLIAFFEEGPRVSRSMSIARDLTGRFPRHMVARRRGAVAVQDGSDPWGRPFGYDFGGR